MRCRFAFAAGASTLIVVGCTRVPARDVDAYCAALQREQANLVLPIATLNDIDATVDRYRAMSKRAPLAVQPQWERLAALVQAAATVDITNNEARLRIVQQAYETEQDSIDVTRHAAEVCQVALDISGTTTAPTTTAPPTTPVANTSSPLPASPEVTTIPGPVDGSVAVAVTSEPAAPPDPGTSATAPVASEAPVPPPDSAGGVASSVP